LAVLKPTVWSEETKVRPWNSATSAVKVHQSRSRGPIDPINWFASIGVFAAELLSNIEAEGYSLLTICNVCAQCGGSVLDRDSSLQLA
jgi:hypothetical protein